MHTVGVDWISFSLGRDRDRLANHPAPPSLPQRPPSAILSAGNGGTDMHWLRMVIAYRRAAGRWYADDTQRLTIPVSLALYLPIGIIAWALIVLVARRLLGW